MSMTQFWIDAGLSHDYSAVWADCWCGDDCVETGTVAAWEIDRLRADVRTWQIPSTARLQILRQLEYCEARYLEYLNSLQEPRVNVPAWIFVACLAVSVGMILWGVL